MYRNMLSDMSLMDQTHLFGIKGFLFQDSTYMEFVDKVHDDDRERYLIERETLAYLVDMLMLIVIRPALRRARARRRQWPAPAPSRCPPDRPMMAPGKPFLRT